MKFNRGFTYREQFQLGTTRATVLGALSSRHAHSSEAVWRERISAGEVRVDGVPALPDQVLRPGQWLEWDRAPWAEPDVPLHYELLHEDEAIVAVAKPRGLPTMPAGGFLDHTLLALVRERWPEASPLHRLGRSTSGLVLFARSAEARSLLSGAWREREVEKLYRALASGDVPWDERTIEVPIGPVPHPTLGTIHAASPAGKQARSVATVVARTAEGTLLDVAISTGRPHQIRIHLASAGHPLAGDPLYGPGGVASPDALPGDAGYKLHAMRLAFVHPQSGERMELYAPPPSDLTA